MFNNNKTHGITLIALVVTIVVLLILAGVSISMLTGENGIITQAKKSNEETQIGEEKELVSLATSSIRSNKIINNDNTPISEKELKDELDKQTDKVQSVTTENDTDGNSILVVTFKSERKYNVDPGIEEAKNLIDVVEVGDYINYPITYDNVIDIQDDSSGQPLGTGWRVFSNNNGKITLISEGIPMDVEDSYHMESSVIGAVIEEYTTNFDKITNNKFINSKYAISSSGLTVELLNNYLESEGQEKIGDDYGEQSFGFEIYDNHELFYKDYIYIGVFNRGIDIYGVNQILVLTETYLRAKSSGSSSAIFNRVVVNLKDDIKCIGGNGTKELPYELQ